MTLADKIARRGIKTAAQILASEGYKQSTPKDEDRGGYTVTRSTWSKR